MERYFGKQQKEPGHQTRDTASPVDNVSSPDDGNGSLAQCHLTCRLTCALRFAFRLSSLLAVLPTSWRGAGRRFLDLGGLPGPGLPGFGALARLGRIARMFRKPRRTRAEVRRPAGAAPFQWQAEVGGERP